MMDPKKICVCLDLQGGDSGILPTDIPAKIGPKKVLCGSIMPMVETTLDNG